MKISLFAAAVIGIVSQTQAIKIVEDEDYADYELAEIDEEYPEYDYDLAQIDQDEEEWELAQTETDSDAEPESDLDADAQLSQTNSDSDAEAQLAQINSDSDADAYAQVYSDYDEDNFAQSDAESEYEFAQSDAESEYEFAQTESEAEIESEDLAQIGVDTEGEGEVLADACQQIVNGVTIRLTTPECTGAAAAKPAEVQVPFESAMLGALKELGNKSNDLAAALDIQFKKNAALTTPKLMAISGTIAISPSVESSMVTPPPAPGAPVAPTPANTQTITIQAAK